MSDKTGPKAKTGRTPASESRVGHADLLGFVTACYARAGLADGYARQVAKTLVELELRGIATHGLMRLPFYIHRLLDGGLNPNPQLRLERDYPASGLLDGDHGPGQLVATRAMEIAIEKARRCGTGFVAVKNSDHFGASGTFAMQAAKADMIGMVWSNAFSVMAPWGGYGNGITNAPLAYAIPASSHRPILLDISMSAVSGGKVRLAAKKGERIPTSWVVDKNGRVTEDPNALTDGGALLPMGGHKGYGLAVVCDVLCGALSGGPYLTDVPLWFARTAEHSRTGHVMMALDVSKFRDLPSFKADVDAVIDRLKATPRMEGFDEVLVPGELEFRLEEEYMRDGIPVPEPVIADMRKLGNDLDVALPADWGSV
ncbi:MAG: Ldh family oxidoreductase [Rhodospirillales bacterium]|nr:Ldh family oxidoreductase [Rhodospirillales bacterium]